MQEREKKHLTEIQYKGVISRSLLVNENGKDPDLLAKTLKDGGYEIISDTTPWRSAFSEFSDDQLPGVVLVGARHKEGLTQKQLAEKLGIPQSHISEMENSKRPIGKSMAKRLAKVLGVGYKIFL